MNNCKHFSAFCNDAYKYMYKCIRYYCQHSLLQSVAVELLHHMFSLSGPMSASSGCKFFWPIMEENNKRVISPGIGMVTVAMPAPSCSPCQTQRCSCSLFGWCAERVRVSVSLKGINVFVYLCSAVSVNNVQLRCIMHRC